MQFFKQMLTPVLLMTVLYKDTVQDLRCILNERTVCSHLLREYLRVSK